MTKFDFNMPVFNENTRNKGLIAISNDIIKTRYKLSLPTQKLLLFLISEIEYEEKKAGIFIKDHEYNLNIIYDFFKQTGVKNSKDLKGKLKNCIEEINKNTIDISKTDEWGKEYYAKYPWYSKIELNEDSNLFKFKFNNEISSLLLNLKAYFKSNLKEYLNIRSTHAIELYMLLRGEAFTNKKRKYPLDYLKEHFGVSENKAYSDWYVFRVDVLEVVISQLNKETNYFFSYDTERVGRKVGFVIFTMIEKKDIKKLSELVTENFEKLLKEQKLLGFFREKRLYQILYKYDPVEDKLTLDTRKTAINPKDIDGFDSWLVKIGFAKKITSKIFRKSTLLTYVVK